MIPGAHEQLVADADTFSGSSYPHCSSGTSPIRTPGGSPVFGVFGSGSAFIWHGWSEVREWMCGWLRQTELFELTGSNHALQDPRGVTEAMVPFMARHARPAPVRHRQLTDDGRNGA
jgi:hypothetical protein